MNPEGLLRRVEDLPFQKLGEQTLVIVSGTREVHRLNETAGRIWELLERPCTSVDLLRVLTEEYDVDSPEATRELESVLEEMSRKGMIEKVQ